MKTSSVIMPIALLGALVMAACTGDHKGDSSDGKLSVTEWASDMARASEPDTIQDKFAIVVDTDDVHAFDDVIDVSKQQTAAEAAAGD